MVMGEMRSANSFSAAGWIGNMDISEGCSKGKDELECRAPYIEWSELEKHAEITQCYSVTTKHVEKRLSTCSTSEIIHRGLLD